MGGVMTTLIQRNTTVPTKKSEVFSTASDNQTTVEVHVLQGERPMAGDNKTIGRFHLDGIPPAPRGMPQVEVTFDIDANGILHVSAKDRATSKEQSIRIEASSGLAEEEIKNMVRDAESHADDDKQRKESVEARNRGDHMAYEAEKNLKEHSEKLDASIKSEVEAGINALREALKGTDTVAIKTATQQLEQAWHKAAAELYKSTPPPGASGPGDGGATGDGDAPVPEEEQKRKSGKDGAVDADFEVMN
jgi:molecular chaperone DnaK